jgi:glucokinase
MKTTTALGIDIGGTNICCALVSDEGELSFEQNFSTKNFIEPSHLVAQVYETYVALIQQNNFELAGIGMGAPNGNFFSGSIEHAPNMPWKGIVPLAKLFAEKFNCLSLLTNDANAAAIGEMQFGAAKGMKDFLMITLGTGLGSGVVSNGQLIYGHDGFAGELGHTIYDYNGRPCGCGRKGCLETYCSATGIVRTVQEWLSDETVITYLRNEENLTAKNIYEAAKAGDALALKAFDFTAEILGRKLADAVAVTSPQAIVLFGGLANAGALLFEPTKKYMEANMLFVYKNKVQLLPSLLKENEAAIIGAASLIYHQLKK